MKADSNPNLRYTLIHVCLFCMTAFFAPLLAAETVNSPSIPKLFDGDDTIAVTISAPWKELIRNKKYQGTYPATIKYRDHNGNSVTHELTVERRGVKRQEACRMPPIRLRFEKDEVKNTLFRGQTSLKMVTHCQNSERYDQYYILEMMAYRMYNLVTDYSFRVRPLEVSYRENDGTDEEEPRFAFLIEDDSDVAKRNGLKKLEIPYVLPSRLDARTTGELALFQFMIGNVDWSALKGPDPEECCHNVKLVAPRPLKDGDKIWPAPYDFDASGIVDAPYASPPEHLTIKSVTQRLYRGYCAHNGTLPDSRQDMLAKQAAILGVLDSDERLTERSRDKAARFLAKYFGILNNDKDFERKVVKMCRK